MNNKNRGASIMVFLLGVMGLMTLAFIAYDINNHSNIDYTRSEEQAQRYCSNNTRIFEDGSARMPDGSGRCLIPEWGCGD